MTMTTSPCSEFMILSLPCLRVSHIREYLDNFCSLYPIATWCPLLAMLFSAVWKDRSRNSACGLQVLSEAGTGFALSSLGRVVESRLVRAARPFRATGTLGVP